MPATSSCGLGPEAEVFFFGFFWYRSLCDYVHPSASVRSGCDPKPVQMQLLEKKSCHSQPSASLSWLHSTCVRLHESTSISSSKNGIFQWHVRWTRRSFLLRNNSWGCYRMSDDIICIDAIIILDCKCKIWDSVTIHIMEDPPCWQNEMKQNKSHCFAFAFAFGLASHHLVLSMRVHLQKLREVTREHFHIGISIKTLSPKWLKIPLSWVNSFPGKKVFEGNRSTIILLNICTD